MCVSKLCDDKWCVDKLCVSGRRRRRWEEAEGGGGIQNQKQEPHTKMWGTTVLLFCPALPKTSLFAAVLLAFSNFQKIACNHTKNAANTNHVLLPTALTSSNNLNHKHKSHTSKRHVFRTLQIHIAFQNAGLPVCNQPYPHPNIQQPAVRI